ncbi:MAG: YaeQ family protein [Myxococcales bacterium]|nr:YaeQ family protein [Myxococcales bacterium]MCB9522594.1 YaeQ family protein [Myxococcales bacterium]
MALPSTMHGVTLDISDIDRGVYASADLRVARHPSETLDFLVTRLIAYCLAYHEDLAFGRGVSTADEPTAWVKDPTGRILLWLDVGAPSPERIHKAAKKAEQVLIVTHKDPDTVAGALQAAGVHRGAEIEVIGVPTPLVDALAETVDRRNQWAVVHTEGVLYVTVDGVTHEAALVHRRAG